MCLLEDCFCVRPVKMRAILVCVGPAALLALAVTAGLHGEGEASKGIRSAPQAPLIVDSQKHIDVNLVDMFVTNFGTFGGGEAVEKFGDLPIKNWQLGSWVEGAKKVCGQAMQPAMLDKHYSCYACPIRCGKIYKHEGLKLYGHGPEYETIGMLGANCLNDDPESIAESNEWCNRYGIDTISAGAVIALRRKGVLKV